MGSRDSNTCNQTVLLCDPKFRSHTLCTRLTQKFSTCGSRRWSRRSQNLLSTF